MRAASIKITQGAWLLAVLVGFWACGGGSAQPLETDGDAEGAEQIIPCETLVDCPPPLVCIDGRCLSSEDSIDDCESNLDCPATMKCDLTYNRCVPLSEDGDIDDIDTPDQAEEDEREPEEDEIGDGDTEEEEPDIPEPILVTFISPKDGEVMDDLVAIAVDVDSELPIDRVEIVVFSETVAVVEQPPYVGEWDASAFEEGAVEIRASAFSGERVESARITVVVDHSYPAVEIVSPTDGQSFYFPDQIQVSLNAGDNLKTVELFIDGTLATTIRNFPEDQPITHAIPAESQTPGAHTLTARATDKVNGHLTTEDSVEFQIDAEGPVLLMDPVQWNEENPPKGYLTAESALTVRFEDPSGLSEIYFELKDPQNRSLIKVESPEALPLVISNLSALFQGTVVFPVDVFVLASASDRFGNESIFTRTITLGRLRWTYDPGLPNPYAGYHQVASSAASTQTGNIYVTLFDELHAIESTEGQPVWQCDSFYALATTPVVAEMFGFAPVVFVADVRGKIIARVDDPEETVCVEYEPDTELTQPAAPAVDSVTAVVGGYSVKLVYCAQKVSDSKCFMLEFLHVQNEEGDWESAFATPVWTRTLANLAPPSSPVIPRSNDYELLSVGTGDTLQQIERATGDRKNSFKFFTQDQTIRTVSANTVGVGLNAASDKEFHVFTWNLLVRESINFSTAVGDADIFLANQVIADREGTFFLSTRQMRIGALKGIVVAIPFVQLEVGDPMWEFQIDGLMGGTPAVGVGDILYVPSGNASGRIWALDIYKETANQDERILWSVQPGSPVFGPLLITPAGDLIVVGDDLKVRAYDIPGTGMDDEAAWPMHQARPQRTGVYYP
ncbi:MAG: hypothetical protein C4523_04210 [Myxococcales bacterium]|nr:MAG: hypothetical protein C4523_04210 [Myxococcales bacterium]